MKIEIPVWERATLSLAEASAYSNIGLHTLKAYILLAEKGKADFPFFKVGNTYKVPRLQLLEWLREQAQSHSNLDVKKLVERLEETAKRGRPRKKVM